MADQMTQEGGLDEPPSNQPYHHVHNRLRSRYTGGLLP